MHARDCDSTGRTVPDASQRPSSGYWDMREDLGNDDLAAKYLLHGIENATGSGIDPNVALLAVLADDDDDINPDPDADDDISNGSPNYETINAAFRKHDLATDNVAYVDIDSSAGAPGDVAEDEDLTISVVVDDGSLTLASTDPVKLRWRVNSNDGPGGGWTEVTMNYGAPATYSYTIDDANYTVGDVIDFYLRAEVTDTAKQFTCFPTQAQFDWTASPPAEERDFFSVVVTNDTKIVALSTDLKDDPSWEFTTGEWEYGIPTAEELSEQPGNDYPYDDDGPTPLPKCYFTSTTDPVEDEDTWRLTTEAFDLSGLDGTDDKVVVSYALWFYVRKGSSTGEPDKFTVELGDGTNWVQIDSFAATGTDGQATALSRYIRRRVMTADTGSHTAGRKLRFSAKHITGNGVVEAVIDEVRVWGVIDD